MSLARQAGWALFWNTAFMPIKGLVALAVSVVVVRLLRTDGFAALTVVTSLLTTLGLYSDLGIERSISRFIPHVEAAGGRRAVAKLLMVLLLVKGGILVCLALGLMVWSPWILREFRLEGMGWQVTAYIAIMLFLGALSDFSIQTLYAHFRQKATNALDVLASLVNPLLTAAFILLGMGIWGALLAVLATTLASTGLSVYWGYRAISSSAEGSGQLPPGIWADFARYAGLSYLITITAYFSDLPFLALLMTHIGSASDVAILALAFKLVRQVLRLLVVPLTGIQAPIFARVRAERAVSALSSAYGSLTRLLTLLMVPSALGLISVGNHLLSLLYLQKGSDAVLRADNLQVAYLVVVVLTLAFFGEALLSSAQTVLMVYERYAAVVACRVVVLLGIPAALLMAGPAGSLGVACAVGMAALASRVASSAYLSISMRVPFPARFLGKVTLASGAIVVVVAPLAWLLPPSWPVSLGIIVLGVVLFLLAFRALGGLAEEDKRYILSAHLPFAKLLVRWA